MSEFENTANRAPIPAGQESPELFGMVFGDKRELLAERLTLMLIDLGGLAYEMAIRNHFRLDVLVNKASEVQGVDAELGQLDRLLSLGRSGAAGDCPNCGALFARGAAFCSSCGFELVATSAPNAQPHVAQPTETLPSAAELLERGTSSQ